MRVLVAPDSFKETLSAVEVAEAIAAGVREASPAVEVDLCPVGDGGEGTVEAIVRAAGGAFREADAVGPLGEERQGRYGVLPDGTAVIEMAAVAGLALVPPERRNPLRTTTFGVGCLIRACLDACPPRIIVGIGGSATVDGGTGCAQPLGVMFLDRLGKAIPCGVTGGDLAGLSRIDASDYDERLDRTDLLVACDVSNPLTGPDGAAAVYAPQKGATPEMVQLLEAGLAHLAALIRRDLGVDVEHLPGGGAAGGLGAGLVAFAGARLQAGIEVVAGAVRLAERIGRADLVITGEGRYDSQSAFGKAAFGVGQAAARAGVPAICIPAQAEGGVSPGPFAAIRPLVDGCVTVEQAMAEPARLLALRAGEAIREWHW